MRGHAWRVERSVRCSRAKLGPDPLGPTRGVPKGVETWEGGMEYHAVTFAIITAHAGPGKSILQLHTLLQAGTHTHALNTQTHIRLRTTEKQVRLNTRMRIRLHIRTQARVYTLMRPLIRKQTCSTRHWV